MAKISDIYRWLYGLITGRPTNFNWIVEWKLAGSGVPMSKKEVSWLINTQGIKPLLRSKKSLCRKNGLAITMGQTLVGAA